MSHDHRPAPAGHERAFRVGIALNVLYVVIEAVCGVVFNSVALIADAGHNLADVFALALAWGAAWVSRAASTERRTYGMKRATVLASLASAVLLCVGLGAIMWEALARLSQPPATSGLTIVLVAAVGVLVNALSALLFLREPRRDLNVRSAVAHLSADAAVSLGVVVAGVVMHVTGWLWVDPAAALAVAALILVSGAGLLRESLDLAMDAVPRHIDAGAVRAYLESLPAVADVHHLHIWGMSTTETALTVHLVTSGGRLDDALLQSVSATLRERFAIDHPTIQVEGGSAGEGCVYEEPSPAAHAGDARGGAAA